VTNPQRYANCANAEQIDVEKRSAAAAPLGRASIDNGRDASSPNRPAALEAG
jgi:hypothetical protein